MPSLTRFGYIFGALGILLVVGTINFAPDTATRFALGFERHMAGLEERRVDVDGFTMPYLVGGEGPTLLLLHGFSANKDNFTRVAKHLSRDFRLVIPDLPGFGDASAPADADYGLAAQVARISGFIDVLELDKPIFVGGNSMGGYLAAATAIARPDAVRGLWLLAPAGLVGSERSEVRADYERTGDIALLARSEEDFSRVMDLVFFETPYLPGFVRDTLARRAVERRSHYERIFRQIYQAEPLNGQLDGIKAPTLLVWGDEDRVLNPSGAEVYMDARPDTALQLLPQIGHLPMMEAPESVAEAWLQFVEDHFDPK